ncbi:hypothetical protein BKI51_10350 [Alphaproteobacteria bacterium AO1-B]|nr:hypothetical protein BKI51_10350 [Alphaproteobacteria bacterium AO1-B]
MSVPRPTARERRDQIIETACELFLEKGLANVSTRDVTTRLNMGSGLLHHHFVNWQALRAETVDAFVHSEITDLEQRLSCLPADLLVETFVDWMAQDDEHKHWNLWLNAIVEGRQDAALEEVMKSAYARWHKCIAALLVRVSEARGLKNFQSEAAAWRLSALIDGLAGILVTRTRGLTLDEAKKLIIAQFEMELGYRQRKSEALPAS